MSAQRRTGLGFSRCVKKCYTEISANREIERYRRLALSTGHLVERAKAFCKTCNAWHINYPNSRKREPLDPVQKRELAKIRRQPFLKIGLKLLAQDHKALDRPEPPVI